LCLCLKDCMCGCASVWRIVCVDVPLSEGLYVWMCLCLKDCMCGCASAWRIVCVDVSLPEGLYVWMCLCLKECMCGCASAWRIVCVDVPLPEGLYVWMWPHFIKVIKKKVAAAGIWSLYVTHICHSDSKGLWKTIRKRKRGGCVSPPARGAFGTKWYVKFDTKLTTSSCRTVRIRPWSKEKPDSHIQTRGQNWPANDSLLLSYHLLEDVRTATGVKKI